MVCHRFVGMLQQQFAGPVVPASITITTQQPLSVNEAFYVPPPNCTASSLGRKLGRRLVDVVTCWVRSGATGQRIGNIFQCKRSEPRLTVTNGCHVAVAKRVTDGLAVVRQPCARIHARTSTWPSLSAVDTQRSRLWMRGRFLQRKRLCTSANGRRRRVSRHRCNY